MRHFDNAYLSDAARGAADTDRRRALRRHLDAGCASCGKAFAAFREVAALARKNARQAPPRRAVGAARAFFASRQPQKLLRLEPIRLRLAFDSLMLPVPAGVRGARPAQRQLVYHSQDYALEVRLESHREPDGLTVVGEVLNRQIGPVAHVPTLLLTDSRTLDRTHTGSYGEFELECRRECPLRLRLLVEEGRCIDVDLGVTPVPGPDALADG